MLQFVLKVTGKRLAQATVSIHHNERAVENLRHGHQRTASGLDLMPLLNTRLTTKTVAPFGKSLNLSQGC